MQWFGVILFYLISNIFIRIFIDAIIHTHYSKSRIKKLKKNQSFLEWFFYKKFRERIAKWVFIYYNACFICSAAVSVLLLIFTLLKIQSKVISAISTGYAFVFNILLLIIYKMFRKRNYSGFEDDKLKQYSKK